MKFTVKAIDKAGVEKSLTVEAESKEQVEKGLGARGYLNIRFVEPEVADGLSINETPVPPTPTPPPAAMTPPPPVQPAWAAAASPEKVTPPAAHAAAAVAGTWFRNFMFFRSLITAAYITWIWWIGCILITLGTIVYTIIMIYWAVSDKNWGLALVSLIAAPVFWAIWIFVFRLICEFVIVIFRIYEELRELNRKISGPSI